jgi:hypothetical protein
MTVCAILQTTDVCEVSDSLPSLQAVLSLLSIWLAIQGVCRLLQLQFGALPILHQPNCSADTNVTRSREELLPALHTRIPQANSSFNSLIILP